MMAFESLFNSKYNLTSTSDCLVHLVSTLAAGISTISVASVTTAGGAGAAATVPVNSSLMKLSLHSTILIEKLNVDGSIQITFLDVLARTNSATSSMVFAAALGTLLSGASSSGSIDGYIHNVRIINKFCASLEEYRVAHAELITKHHISDRVRSWVISHFAADALKGIVEADQLRTAKGLAQAIIHSDQIRVERARRGEIIGDPEVFFDLGRLHGCKIYQKTTLPTPAELIDMCGDYCCVKNLEGIVSLYKVSSIGQLREVRIEDQNLFKREWHKLTAGSNVDLLFLNKNEFKKLVTDSGGHEFVPSLARRVTFYAQLLYSCERIVRMGADDRGSPSRIVNFLKSPILDCFLADNFSKLIGLEVINSERLLPYNILGLGGGDNCTSWCVKRLAEIGIKGIKFTHKPDGATGCAGTLWDRCSIM